MTVAGPGYVRFRFARQGELSDGGRLPSGWTFENWGSVLVDDVDSGPDGPSITLTATFGENDEAEFYSLVLGDYVTIAHEDLLVMRLDMATSESSNVAAAFVVLREWIAGGSYVGQATRPVALGDKSTTSVVARTAMGENRVLQPLLTFRRAAPGPGKITFTVSRVAIGSLYDHPAWLQS